MPLTQRSVRDNKGILDRKIRRGLNSRVERVEQMFALSWCAVGRLVLTGFLSSGYLATKLSFIQSFMATKPIILTRKARRIPIQGSNSSRRMFIYFFECLIPRTRDNEMRAECASHRDKQVGWEAQASRKVGLMFLSSNDAAFHSIAHDNGVILARKGRKGV
jgi:hypothetical protein